MNFAFDIDGTITSYPLEFKSIMKALLKDGHQVYVLTGAVGPPGCFDLWREGQLESHGITADCYTDLIICFAENDYEGVGRLKADFCKEKQISMIHEDTDIFINAIKRDSPKTATMKVICA